MTGGKKPDTMKKQEGGWQMASSVIGRLDSQVDKIFFQKGLSRSVDEQERLENMSPEEREDYLKEKKKREDDIVLY